MYIERGMFAFRGHHLWDLATGGGETGLHQLGLRDVCKGDVGARRQDRVLGGPCIRSFWLVRRIPCMAAGRGRMMMEGQQRAGGMLVGGFCSKETKSIVAR